MLAVHQQKRKKSRSHRVSMARHFLRRKGKTLSEKQWHKKYTLNKPISTPCWPQSEAWLMLICLLCMFKGHLNGTLSLGLEGRWGARGMYFQHPLSLDLKFWIPSLCKSVFKHVHESS